MLETLLPVNMKMIVLEIDADIFLSNSCNFNISEIEMSLSCGH